MAKYIALLRGIAPMNPNMRNNKLREFFEGLGFRNVRTVISSGNVIFDPPAGGDSNNPGALEEKIEENLPQKLGFNSSTIIRSREQLLELEKKDFFKGKEDLPESRFNITFLKRAPFEVPFVVDTTQQGNTPNMMLEHEKKYGREITTRTWKTVLRILAAMEKE
jgi:uncharacterized protein (DUF1697 family)